MNPILVAFMRLYFNGRTVTRVEPSPKNIVMDDTSRDRVVTFRLDDGDSAELPVAGATFAKHWRAFAGHLEASGWPGVVDE